MGSLTKFNLKNYKQKYNSNVFIETGTWTGDGVAHAAQVDFEALYSIELIEDIFLKAQQRFADNPKVKIFNDSSISGLKYILQNLTKREDRIIFWLDAHLPHHYDENIKNDYQSSAHILIPLEEEIKIIKQFKDISGDVFFIDDLRIYEEGPFEQGNWYEVLNSNLYPSGIKFLEDLLQDTHDVYRDYSDQGYIVCLPKQLK